jgi:hypothetical protein
MALESLLGVAGAIKLAGVIASLPVAGHRGRLKEDRKLIRPSKEKEFGPPEFEDFIAVWEGLCNVRRSEHYGLSSRSKGVVTRPDVTYRVASLCKRADWRVLLERKLIALAMRRDVNDAEKFYPGRGWPFGSKSKLTAVECKKVLEYMKKVGLLIDMEKHEKRLIGHPIFEYAHRPEVFAKAFAIQAGNPTDSIAKEKHQVVYEFFSLDVGQVLSEQGRYYLMKGCAEITTDPKMGFVKVRLFQRWGPSPKQRGMEMAEGGPFGAMDEEYEGHLFMQDDVLYALTFKSNRNPHGLEVKNDAKHRRNLVSLVLSGFSRDADGFHRKLTGGQLGQGIGGTVGVLAAPCVFYRVGEDRLAEIKADLQHSDPKHWTRLSEGKSKDNLNYEILKWDSAFIDLMNGVEQRFAPVMSDLDVPMPIPTNDEEGGPEVFVLGKGQH